MKKKLKILIDITMYILFVLLMGYHITGNNIHEVLGVITFILFFLHHILNKNYYKTIFKGKYPRYRILLMITNILLFLAMIGIISSSIMISSKVFAFLNIQTTMFGRNLHMISTSWGFILMAIHLGLHLNIFFTKWLKKIKNNTLEYVYYLGIALIMIYGLYTLIDTGIIKDMFLLNQFKFFDYDQNPILFYLGEIAITFLIVQGTYLFLKIKKRNKN